LNDVVGLFFFDTRAGGFLDADMRDHADASRTVLSELTLTQTMCSRPVSYPISALLLAIFGSVLFELNAGNTDGHLNFLQFNAASTITIPLATLGNPGQLDFFAGYASGGGYNSNESSPPRVRSTRVAIPVLGMASSAGFSREARTKTTTDL